MVRNFLRSRDGAAWIIGKKFNKQEDLYEYPAKSSDIGVYAVSSLERNLKIWPLVEISSKVVSLKFSNDGLNRVKSIRSIFPLLHHHG